MITTYNGMKVYASFDRTQCGLEHGIEEGFLITSEMEGEWDSPIFLQGPTDALKGAVGKDVGIEKLYNEIKSEKYFMIITSEEDDRI
jgi:hypothetical protein